MDKNFQKILKEMLQNSLKGKKVTEQNKEQLSKEFASSLDIDYNKLNKKEKKEIETLILPVNTLEKKELKNNDIFEKELTNILEHQNIKIEIKKTEKRIKQKLINSTNKFFTERTKHQLKNYKLISKENNIETYQVKSESKNKYYNVQILKVDNEIEQVSCNCSDYLYTFSFMNYKNNIHLGNLQENFKTDPKKRNSNNHIGVCKHLYSIILQDK